MSIDRTATIDIATIDEESGDSPSAEMESDVSIRARRRRRVGDSTIGERFIDGLGAVYRGLHLLGIETNQRSRPRRANAVLKPVNRR